jgi:hypothetical protein
MHAEYVTDPVPWPRLRCAKCGMRVRQMREALSPSHSVLVFLSGEPLAWLVVGTGLLVGFFAEAVAILFVAWALLIPADIGTYAESRNAAHRFRSRVSQL